MLFITVHGEVINIIQYKRYNHYNTANGYTVFNIKLHGDHLIRATFFYLVHVYVNVKQFTMCFRPNWNNVNVIPSIFALIYTIHKFCRKKTHKKAMNIPPVGLILHFRQNERNLKTQILILINI